MARLTQRTLYGILEQNQKRTYITCAVICFISISIIFFAAKGIL